MAHVRTALPARLVRLVSCFKINVSLLAVMDTMEIRSIINVLLVLKDALNVLVKPALTAQMVIC